MLKKDDVRATIRNCHATNLSSQTDKLSERKIVHRHRKGENQYLYGLGCV